MSGGSELTNANDSRLPSQGHRSASSPLASLIGCRASMGLQALVCQGSCHALMVQSPCLSAPGCVTTTH